MEDYTKCEGPRGEKYHGGELHQYNIRKGTDVGDGVTLCDECAYELTKFGYSVREAPPTEPEPEEVEGEAPVEGEPVEQPIKPVPPDMTETAKVRLMEDASPFYDCPQCKGKGYRPCRFCGGKGCRRCENGRSDCRLCGGEGVIERNMYESIYMMAPAAKRAYDAANRKPALPTYEKDCPKCGGVFNRSSFGDWECADCGFKQGQPLEEAASPLTGKGQAATNFNTGLGKLMDASKSMRQIIGTLFDISSYQQKGLAAAFADGEFREDIEYKVSALIRELDRHRKDIELLSTQFPKG